MNQIYARESEDKVYELLKHFNSFLGLNNLGRYAEKHTTDASGTTADGKIVNIELKQRNLTVLKDLTISGTNYTADTVYIESHKVADMLLDYVCYGMIPLYINFLNDGYVVVYNLSTLKHRPAKVAKIIYSKLYQGFEMAKREELILEDAYIYKRENNEYKLIHRP